MIRLVRWVPALESEEPERLAGGGVSMDEARWDPREPKPGYYSLTWKDVDGTTHSMEASGLDISVSGAGIECSSE